MQGIRTSMMIAQIKMMMKDHLKLNNKLKDNGQKIN